MSATLDAPPALPTAVPRSSATSVLKPLILSRGTILTADLDRAQAFYETFLGLECKRMDGGRMMVRDTDPARLRHRNGGPYWVMDVQQVEGTVTTAMLRGWPGRRLPRCPGPACCGSGRGLRASRPRGAAAGRLDRPCPR
jgi:catechol 2,3-dioxygenase-like lactoylglutathione lyase family enzyme